ncbi:hypothetical protein [Actinobaculum sp. 313]|uniref:hypothetical protein n=1 Tax=Actinobaculum sp. 313 TaxID=2495645 RepID=UPI000D5287BD|nr:hypothetical protein [Actinobaculum sp. 313]AWE43257.1 hypothetical protein DDD63_11445 [Actinobaculum sp. 313]
MVTLADDLANAYLQAGGNERYIEIGLGTAKDEPDVALSYFADFYLGDRIRVPDDLLARFHDIADGDYCLCSDYEDLLALNKELDTDVQG